MFNSILKQLNIYSANQKKLYHCKNKISENLKKKERNLKLIQCKTDSPNTTIVYAENVQLASIFFAKIIQYI